MSTNVVTKKGASILGVKLASSNQKILCTPLRTEKIISEMTQCVERDIKPYQCLLTFIRQKI